MSITVTGVRKSNPLFTQKLQNSQPKLRGDCIGGRDFRQLLEAARGLPIENPQRVWETRPTGTPEWERRASQTSAAADLGRAAG